jgi:hypothetical protein
MNAMRMLTADEQTEFVVKMSKNIRVAMAATISDGYMDAMISSNLMQLAICEALASTFRMLPSDEMRIAHLETFKRVLDDEVQDIIKGEAEVQ